MKQALDTRTKLLTKSPWPLMIELSIYGILVVAALGLMMSCNEGKSYSDLLRDEEVAVN